MKKYLAVTKDSDKVYSSVLKNNKVVTLMCNDIDDYTVKYKKLIPVCAIDDELCLIKYIDQKEESYVIDYYSEFDGYIKTDKNYSFDYKDVIVNNKIIGKYLFGIETDKLSDFLNDYSKLNIDIKVVLPETLAISNIIECFFPPDTNCYFASIDDDACKLWLFIGYENIARYIIPEGENITKKLAESINYFDAELGIDKNKTNIYFIGKNIFDYSLISSVRSKTGHNCMSIKNILNNDLERKTLSSLATSIGVALGL